MKEKIICIFSVGFFCMCIILAVVMGIDLMCQLDLKSHIMITAYYLFEHWQHIVLYAVIILYFFTKLHSIIKSRILDEIVRAAEQLEKAKTQNFYPPNAAKIANSIDRFYSKLKTMGLVDVPESKYKFTKSVVSFLRKFCRYVF